MPEGFVCEIYPYEEVRLEMALHIQRNRKTRKFLVHY